jgi:hypothetical protein
MCAHTFEGCLQLKDVVVQTTYEVLWKKLEKVIEKLGKLIELEAKHPPLDQNMIKFGHNGL